MKNIILSILRLRVLTVTIYIFFSIVSNTVSSTIICNQKIVDLKHNINQLRQISDAHSQCLIQIQKQLSENQHNIDVLQGYIQEIQHKIMNIENNQKKNFKDLEKELNNSNSIHNLNDTTQLLINSKKENHQSITNNTTTATIKNNKDSDLYQKAVSLVLDKKQYDQAIKTFQNFIYKYPESHYQPNAHYWLGQLLYNKGNKNEASHHFAIVVKNYPKSLKSPDALLKLGIIMQETNQFDKAKTIYNQINKIYPNTYAAQQAQKRLSILLQ